MGQLVHAPSIVPIERRLVGTRLLPFAAFSDTRSLRLVRFWWNPKPACAPQACGPSASVARNPFDF